MARVIDSFDEEYEDEHDQADSRSFRDQIDLQHYLRILRKYKWPITLFSAAVTGLAGYYAYTATPVYSAESTLLIEQQKTTGIEGIQELIGVKAESADYYQTQYELLKSRALAAKVIDRLELWDDPLFSSAAKEAQMKSEVAQKNLISNAEDGAVSDGGVQGFVAKIKNTLGLGPSEAVDIADSVEIASAESMDLSGEQSTETAGQEMAIPGELSERDRQEIISKFMQGLTISPIRRTKLVHIGYVSTDQALTATVANTYAEQYIESYLDAKMEMTTKATSWLTERLASLKVTLDDSKSKLLAYKQANDLVDVNGSVGRLNEQELFMLTTELAEARSQLSSANDVYRQVQSLRGTPELLETLPAMQLDPLVQRVKIEQGQAQRQLDELLNRYGARHPKVIDAKSQLSTLDSTLAGHLSRVAATIQSDYQLVRQNVATIQAKLAQGKQEIQAIGSKKIELDEIEREVATNQELYDTFFNRMSEARSADGLETANARLSDPAVIPNAPFKPKKQLIIAIAALASLMLSMLMAFLYEQMDDTIKSTNDVEGKLGVRLLGIFPLIKSGMFKGTRSLPLNPTEITDPKGTFSESVNTVRTALCMDDGDVPRKIIMVTSSVPGEGKSTVSINLSYSLGQLERVLLIDCDMRRPTVAKAAGFDKNIPGLSSLITGTASARDCIKRGVFENSVDILPSGPIPDQPLELLSSKRFEKILEQLAQHYDRIIIDCAPTQAVSDALVLSKLSDAVVYAVKSHDTSMELVKRGLQRLAQVKAKLAGILITQVDIDRITSYGGDYYYQGYYDYYGYTEKGQKTKRGDKVRLSKEELYQLKTDDSDVQLDLDMPLAGAAAAGGVFHNGVLLNDDDPYDNLTDHAAEFDLTAQLDEEMQSPIERLRRDRNKRKTVGNHSSNDDLDIL